MTGKGRGRLLEPVAGPVEASGLGVKLDWFRGTFPAGHVELVVRLLEQGLGKAELRDKGRYSYGACYVFEQGAFVAFTPTIEVDTPNGPVLVRAGRPEACVEVPGKSCDKLGAWRLLGLVQQLHQLGGHAVRLDPAVDDFDRRLSLDEIDRAARAGNVARFRSYDRRHPIDPITGEVKGDTCYFGVRGSNGGGRYLRVYDKALETGGEANCIRAECEFTQEPARLLGADLAACRSVEEMTAVLAAAVGGCVDFIERSGKVHLERMDRLPWWADFLERLGSAVRYSVQRVKTTIEGKLEWIRRQVAKSAAQVVRAVDAWYGCGRELVGTIIEDANRLLDDELEGGRDRAVSQSMVEKILGRRVVQRARTVACGTGVPAF